MVRATPDARVIFPALWIVLGAMSGCEPPDRPPVLTDGLPPAAVRYLQPDRISSFQLEEGVVYRSVRSRAFPWSVHLLDIDATRCELGFQVVRPDEGEGRKTVSELSRRLGRTALAAVNGDFFTPEDLPVGVEVTAGEVRGRATRPVFAWRPGFLPWVGPSRLEGDSLHLGELALSLSDPDGNTEAVAGFPALLSESAWVGDLQMGDRPAFAAQRHPRTAVGWNPGDGRLWIVVTDGRREGISEGMTLPELAGFLLALGATEAVNLDGGGSSVMVIRGQSVSRPSDMAGERPVANGLAVLWDPAFCPAE